MREITDHIVEGDLPQNQLTIEVTDEPGAGGANHNYVIHGQYGVLHPGDGQIMPSDARKLASMAPSGWP